MGGLNSVRRRGTVMSYGCLWPGLPQMWVGGRWLGLATAAGFALAVETLFLTLFVWDEVLGRAGMAALATFVAGTWLVGVVVNRRWVAQRRHEAALPEADDLFPDALAEYLQGSWFLAEQKCRELIRRRRSDVDARLLLATLLRHTNRFAEARTELNALAKLDGAAKWLLEISHERRLLEEAEQPNDEESPQAETLSPGATLRAA